MVAYSDQLSNFEWTNTQDYQRFNSYISSLSASGGTYFELAFDHWQ